MIVALITLYNPDDTVYGNIMTISNQVDRVYLCDNSVKNNSSIYKDIKNAIYMYNNGENLALSGAFNRVLKNKEFNWDEDDYLLFFDQDSSIQQGHIQGLIDCYVELEQDGYDIGCLGPVYFNRSINKLAIPKMKKQISENEFIVKSIITSSLLCKYGKIEKIGFWNEQVFLDLADWDLCWRFMRENMLCVETKKVILNHAVGTGYKRVGPIGIAETASIREYYQTRNYLYLLQKNYVPFKYKVSFVRNLTVRPILHYFFLDNGKDRLRLVKKGFVDYKRGYFGALN